jgi:hypothetical protein
MALIPTTSLDHLLRFGRWLREARTRRRTPDHRAITQRENWAHPMMTRFYFYGAVAPAWWAPRETDGGQVARAARFVGELLPAAFPQTPSGADPIATIFRRMNPTDSCFDASLRVTPTGLVELAWALEPRIDQDDRVSLSARDIAWLVRRLTSAAHMVSYSAISSFGELPRRKRQLDWAFTLAPSVGTPQGQRSWDALVFDGPQPSRADHLWAAHPVAPYGQTLGGENRDLDPDLWARVVLAELLLANGYYEFDDAIGRTVAAASEIDELPPCGGPLH